MKKSLIVSFIISTFILLFCERDNSSDCRGTRICTEEFRIVPILIKYSADNSPVILTSYKVLRTNDLVDITITDNNLPDNSGYYTIINDSSAGLETNRDTEVEFTGYINDSPVVQRKFIVRRDCCHVSLVSGDTVCFI